MASAYQIAGRLSNADLTRIETASHFARCLGDLFAKFRPRRVVETGTYLGTGTTMIIARALQQWGPEDASFYSIEVNPVHAQKAEANLARAGLSVNILNGLSVPRALLPSLERIEQLFVKSVIANGIVVDHEEADRARLYHRETDFPELPDDLLGKVLTEFNYRPDLVLLDSGGHLGHIEFRYVIDQVRSPCLIALDDIHHVKHFRSFQDLRVDDRFELLVASEEKFGFCIARFNP
jgi:hypothetical protein